MSAASKGWTKAEIRDWARRCRENLREMETALRDGDLHLAQEAAAEAMASATEAHTVLEYATGGSPYGWDADGNRNPLR